MGDIGETFFNNLRIRSTWPVSVGACVCVACLRRLANIDIARIKISTISIALGSTGRINSFSIGSLFVNLKWPGGGNEQPRQLRVKCGTSKWDRLRTLAHSCG
jgi:hypothetical protein